MNAKTNAQAKKKHNTRKAFCHGGLFCIGMKAMLASGGERPRGVHTVLTFDLKGGTTGLAVVHPAVHEGKKVFIRLSFCPCCGADLLGAKS